MGEELALAGKKVLDELAELVASDFEVATEVLLDDELKCGITICSSCCRLEGAEATEEAELGK